MGKVGNETKAAVKAAQGSVVSNTKLSHAVQHLKAEHPIGHADHGPHHGTDHHKVHIQLAGMKPCGHI